MHAPVSSFLFLCIPFCPFLVFLFFLCSCLMESSKRGVCWNWGSHISYAQGTELEAISSRIVPLASSAGVPLFRWSYRNCPCLCGISARSRLSVSLVL